MIRNYATLNNLIVEQSFPSNPFKNIIYIIFTNLALIIVREENIPNIIHPPADIGTHTFKCLPCKSSCMCSARWCLYYI